MGIMSPTAALATLSPTPAPPDRLSDALFRVAIEDATVGVALIDMRGRIRFLNWAAAHMVGYSVAELTGKPLVRILRQASESQIDTLFGACPDLDQPYPRWHARALTARAKDGRPVHVEVSAAKMGLAEEPLVVVFVRDNLRHRRIEDELRKTQRRLEMLNEIMHFAAHHRECPPIWQKVCDTLTGAFGWSMVGCLLQGAGGELCWGPTAGGPAAGTPLDPANLLASRVASERRSTYLPALEAEPDYLPVVSGAQSAILVPVQHRDAILGLLACESRQSGAFADHVIFLESLAEQIAAPLAAALEDEEALRRSRALETLSEVSRIALETTELDEVLERIVGYVQHRFDLPFVYIALADENNEQLQLRSIAAKTILNASLGESFPIAGGSVIGRAFRTGEPQLVPDVSRDPDYLEASPLVRAELAIPIRLHEGVLGVLNLESSDAADFSTESCRILCLLADQVAGAVLLTMMNRRLQQTTEQLAAANADQAKRAGGKRVSLQSR